MVPHGFLKVRSVDAPRAELTVLVEFTHPPVVRVLAYPDEEPFPDPDRLDGLQPFIVVTRQVGGQIESLDVRRAHERPDPRQESLDRPAHGSSQATVAPNSRSSSSRPARHRHQAASSVDSSGKSLLRWE